MQKRSSITQMFFNSEKPAWKAGVGISQREYSFHLPTDVSLRNWNVVELKFKVAP